MFEKGLEGTGSSDSILVCVCVPWSLNRTGSGRVRCGEVILECWPLGYFCKLCSLGSLQLWVGDGLSDDYWISGRGRFSFRHPVLITRLRLPDLNFALFGKSCSR